MNNVGWRVVNAKERVAVGVKDTFFVFVSEYIDCYPGGDMVNGLLLYMTFSY